VSRKKKAKSRADELLDELLGECKSSEDILGRNGLIKQLTKRALERALKGELTTHLGYEPHERASEPHGNTRNGTTPKMHRAGGRGDLSGHPARPGRFL